jgi:DNA-binding NarL/FixJ family response regulator
MMNFLPAKSRKAGARRSESPSDRGRAIRVVIADENPLCRRGLRDLLREGGRFEVVNEAEEGKAALRHILEQNPDVAVLDAGLPEMSGLELAAILKAKDCATRLVIITQQKDEALFNQAISLGIRGYVLKRNAANEILDCIVAVHSGESYVSPFLSDFMLRRRNRTETLRRRKPGLGQLTASERRVLHRIAQGKTSRQIAEELGVSPRTVDSHRAHICEKIGLSGSNRLLQFAIEHRDALWQQD